jgi:glutamate-5-semialdehyde dehydrogenase
MTDPDDLGQLLAEMGRRARAAAQILRLARAEQRTAALLEMAEALAAAEAKVLVANAEDVEAARAAGLAPNMVDRLALDAGRMAGVVAALKTVAAIPDPVGAEMAQWTQPNGLRFSRLRTPIGVVAVIYEARPNVTADAAALCLRAGDATLLRGGSESLRSNLAIHAALARGLEAAGLPVDCIQLVPTADRVAVGHLLSGLDGSIDLLIPRGGRSLVERVQKEARVAVLGHLEGLCHTYVHASADAGKARAIVLDAKLRRTSVCGATETLLIDAEAAGAMLPDIAADLTARGCELRGDARARALVPGMAVADEADWRTEYLAPILSVRVVDGVDAAAAHVARYGSGHTEAIVAEDAAAADRFVALVDSAIVLVNASTQFADGGEFGFGAEIGISTDRLHARGPVGAEQLTTYRYVVRGTGQVRG